MGRSDICGVVGTSFHAKYWLALNPMAFFGLALSWGIHLFALGVIISKLISNSLVAIFVFIVLYLPSATLALVSLFRTTTTNPGAVPMGARPLVTVRRAASSGDNSSVNSATTTTTTTTTTRAIRRCHKCNDNYKPPRAHHDSVTGRCIVRFDHFCPWAGGAIGLGNHKFFCLFLFYTCCTCLLSLLLLVIRLIHCGYYVSSSSTSSTTTNINNDHMGGENNHSILQPHGWSKNESLLVDETTMTAAHLDPNARFLASGDGTDDNDREYLYEECNHFYDSHAVLGLVIASLVFLVFCCAMGCEQLEAIQSGQGKIARMKMRVGNNGTEFARVTEEFNEMFGGTSPDVAWHWFWPGQVQYPRGMKKVVMGYEWDATLPAVPYQEQQPVDEELGSAPPPRQERDLEMKEVSPSSASSAPPSTRTETLVSRSTSELERRTTRRNRSAENLPKIV